MYEEVWNRIEYRILDTISERLENEEVDGSKEKCGPDSGAEAAAGSGCRKETKKSVSFSQLN